MKTKYVDLIEQSFDFPQDDVKLNGDELLWNNIPMMDVVRRFGTPLKIMYLPKISENIQKAKGWFKNAMEAKGYKGSYNYCYCTKPSHFMPVINEAIKNDISIETSSEYDLYIVEYLLGRKSINADKKVVCNGFKTPEYLEHIAKLINQGHKNILPVIDNPDELSVLSNLIQEPFEIGLRIASEEEPKFEFYTSRLGIGYKDILPFYNWVIRNNPKIKLSMLHFFINTGIKDTAYYWNEFTKCLRAYKELKQVCPTLKTLNIGGGLPIKNGPAFEYDYEYMVSEIIEMILTFCKENQIEEPDIYTEFGSFTVGESGANLFSILNQKRQNDKERWNMIDGSFMTQLPDSWAINRRFLMFPLNRWNDAYERVFLGGLTCDSDDYYNAEQHMNAIYLPKFNREKPLYIGFFNTGAYQSSIGGYGGIQHCLIPHPRQLIIDRDKNGELTYKIFAERQSADQMLSHLGYPSVEEITETLENADSETALLNQ